MPSRSHVRVIVGAVKRQRCVLKDPYLFMAIGMALGIGVGAVAGSAMGNTPVGVTAGIAIGGVAGYLSASGRR